MTECGTGAAIRSTRRYDYSRLAELHSSEFEGYFLARLGRDLLELYYETVIDFGQVGVVSEEDGELTGFAAGIDKAFEFYRKLIQRKGLRFFASLTRPVLRNPRVLISITGRLLERGSEKIDPGRRVAHLSYIAVVREKRGTGTAVRLLEGFKEEARARGFDTIEVETDADNRCARQFYEREGFVVDREFSTGGGRSMVAYRCFDAHSSADEAAN